MAEKQHVYIFDPTTYRYLTVVDMTDVPSNGTLTPPIAEVSGKEILLEDAIWNPDTKQWSGSNQELVNANNANSSQSQIAKVAGDLATLQTNFSSLQNSVNLLVGLLVGDDTDTTNTTSGEAD